MPKRPASAPGCPNGNGRPGRLNVLVCTLYRLGSGRSVQTLLSYRNGLDQSGQAEQDGFCWILNHRMLVERPGANQPPRCSGIRPGKDRHPRYATSVDARRAGRPTTPHCRSAPDARAKWLPSRSPSGVTRRARVPQRPAETEQQGECRHRSTNRAFRGPAILRRFQTPR
jgi:hypothetical protein